MGTKHIAIALTLIWSVAAALPTVAADFDVSTVRRGVVYIKSFIPNVGTGVGTGFLVDREGLIYTNRHVIESGNHSHRKSVILVGVPSPKDPEKFDYFRAKVVHVVDDPPSRDFAILKISAQPEYGEFEPLRLAQDKMQLGESVSVLGFPFIQEGEPSVSFTRGTISSTKVVFEGVEFYQTDAAVNPGNSGGPLLNNKGEVAGIITLKISGADNIAYALHLNEILSEIESVQADIASVRPDKGPLEAGQVPDLNKLAAEDSAGGSGTEARTPEWAKAKPFDPINRLWTSDGGRFSVEATYVSSKDDQVSLRRTNGAIIAVPVARLSELDQYYVRAIESPWKKEGRLPAPPPAVLAYKLKEIQGIFEDEFQRGGEELFAKLLDLAIETRAQDPAAAYVCLQQASQTAARSGQLELMFATLAGLERWYEIDDRLLPMQVELLQAAANAVDGDRQRAEALGYAVRLLDFAVERHDVKAGNDLVAFSLTMTSRLRSGAILKLIRSRTNRFEAFREAFELSEAAKKALQSDPDNPKARFALARVMIVFDSDWNEESLSHLAGGSDVSLAEAARKELAAPTTPQTQLAVADAWWEAAQKQPEIDKLAYQLHAAEWYRRCVANLGALDKTKAEKRIADMGFQGEEEQAASSTVIAVTGFNDARGLNANRTRNSPFALGRPNVPGGVGEKGWATPFRPDPKVTYVKIDGSEGDGAAHVKPTTNFERYLAAAPKASFTVEVRVLCPPNGGVTAYVWEDRATTSGPMWRLANGKFEANHGNEQGGGQWTYVADCTPDTWHTVKLSINPQDHSWTMSVDDIQSTQQFGFRHRTSHLRGINFLVEGNKEIYLDALQVLSSE